MPVPPTFLMSGECTPFIPAEPCLVTDGPHYGDDSGGGLLVADAAVKDGTAEVRFALWRCRYCGVMLIGVGRTDVFLTGESDAFGQEFTWLQETTTKLRLALAVPAGGYGQTRRDYQ